MLRPPPTSSLAIQAAVILPLASSCLLLPALVHLDWPVQPLSRTFVNHVDQTLPGLLASVAFAGLAYLATLVAVGACRSTFEQRGFKGRDLLKPNVAVSTPESLGLPACCIYLLALFLLIPFRYYLGAEDVTQTPQMTRSDGGWVGDLGGRRGFPHHELAVYLSALSSLLSSVILGFCDDVFDIRWRFKMPIPIVSSIPMLLVYYAGRGGTGLVVPGWPVLLRRLVGKSVIDLGIFYYIYMALLSVFCTHSINILAGINGVEVGQALIIAASLCLNDLLYLPLKAALSPPSSNRVMYWMLSHHPIQDELTGRHLFSLSLMLPLVGVCAALLAWNRHPALVFVGDTFCYFAGQALACAGVLGHFSKTLLLFFLPQIFNFLFSCPQLFGFVPCPRHRVPKVHEETMTLYPSLAVFSDARPAKTLGTLMLLLLEKLRLVVLHRQRDMARYSQDLKVEYASDTAPSAIIATTNLTLLNAILVLRGVPTPIEHVLNEVSKAQQESTTVKESNKVASTASVESTGESNGSTSTSPSSASKPLSIPAPSPSTTRISEATLWRWTMLVQLLGSGIAFGVRYWIAAIVFPES